MEFPGFSGDAPAVDSHHPVVDALVNLSRFSWTQVRAVADWPGTSASWRPAVCSLAQHLVGKYAVPPFLAGSWYATDDAYAEKKREWFVAHARGASFRSLDLPIEMTRKMEHIFLSSREHLPIEHAMRRAELLALGACDDLVQAVLTTRLATDLRNGAFWRTVWMFMIANAGAIEVAQISPMSDFVQAIRHERVAVETPDGIVLRNPPQPSFSIKGRTVQSMLRLMQDWHRSLGRANGGLTWAPSRLQPMMIEEPSEDPGCAGNRWQLMELTNGAQLRSEATALHHCVASYADRCWRGASRIWSLRVHRREKVRHLLTIEVDMKRRAVVQARDWRNRAPSGRSLPKQIAKALNAEGVRGPRGALWSPSTIHGNPERGIGILHNELYIGRLVWNRQRFLKDPDTGKRVACANPPSEWITKDVPELRIIDDEVWQAVQARYASVQRMWKAAREGRRFNQFRRPKYLFSGLTKCGECGAGFIVYSREQLGCFGTRGRGTCTNKLTIARSEVEQRVLRALRDKLMCSDFFEEFCREFAADLLRELLELIEAPDRRVPQMQRARAVAIVRSDRAEGCALVRSDAGAALARP